MANKCIKESEEKKNTGGGPPTHEHMHKLTAEELTNSEGITARNPSPTEAREMATKYAWRPATKNKQTPQCPVTSQSPHLAAKAVQLWLLWRGAPHAKIQPGWLNSQQARPPGAAAGLGSGALFRGVALRTKYRFHHLRPIYFPKAMALFLRRHCVGHVSRVC
jgi:hypothetical protein